MKIGIDSFGLDHAHSGAGSYLYNLAENLPVKDNLQYEIFGAEIDRYTYGTEQKVPFAAVNVADSKKAQNRWHLFRLNGFASSQKYDVVLCLSCALSLPLFQKYNYVVLVNDVLSESIKGYKKDILKGLKKASKLIASSNFIKDDLLKLGVEESNIAVVPIGLDHTRFYQHPIPENDIVDIKPFSIKRPYIIYPSRVSGPTKKHLELIKAFSLFKQKTSLPHRLVIAGQEDDYAQSLHKVALESNFASDIFFTGFFPYESFAELYSGAAACVVPSVSEGIGFPILEAMTSGIPVAAADAGALPEISGGNALLFNPNDINGFALAIERIVTDTLLRETLIPQGLEWSKKFSWDKTAKKVVDVLQSIQ